ncbi:hypothetical protein [uncultured Tateyamaria sp.]|uniref:alpha/beta hydrolase family protein n=1 Tax=uncultured Tateyamaria sp. TaxID=455651 RepID=UPI002625C067|nr:hypothetical protein [uncultured Tateyamaria sp.]
MAFCGYRTGVALDHAQRNWDGTGPRPLAWSAWYPCTDTSGAAPTKTFFDPGDVVQDATVVGSDRLPVVLLSHGTGGSAESLGWIGCALAAEGYVVIGANHHGNSGVDVRPEGFLCWWDRAADMSALLSELAHHGPFANRLDTAAVTVIGFSLGAYTALALVGARTAWQRFEAWHAENGTHLEGPRECPDVMQSLPDLMANSAVFRASWDRQEADYTDPRVDCVIAIAPPPPVRAFSETSLRDIATPVHLITAQLDAEAPTEHGADWLASYNRAFVHHDMGPGVGHYTFLGLPADANLAQQIDIFTDLPGIDRADVHASTVRIILNALP